MSAVGMWRRPVDDRCPITGTSQCVDRFCELHYSLAPLYCPTGTGWPPATRRVPITGTAELRIGDTLPTGATVEAIYRSSGWVELSDGGHGYIPSNAVFTVTREGL